MPSKKFIDEQSLQNITDQFPQIQDVHEHTDSENLVKIAPLFKTQTMQNIIINQEKSGVIKTITCEKTEKTLIPPDIYFAETNDEFSPDNSVILKNKELHIQFNTAEIRQFPDDIYVLKICLIYQNIIKEMYYPLLNLQNHIILKNILPLDYARYEILKKSDSANTVIYTSPRYNFV